MKGLFVPGITAEMFRNGCLESIEALMAEGEIYDIEYSNWTPVNERLPERAEWYLTSIKWVDGTEKVIISWFDDVSFKAEVTAWMPLPQPYKAESEEEK